VGRILLIAGSSSRIPSLAASSIQVMRMADAFAGLGHEVTLLAPAGRGELAGLRVPDVRAFYGVSAPFTIARAFAPGSGRGAEVLFAAAARAPAASPPRGHSGLRELSRGGRPWDLVLSRHALSTVFLARAGISHVYEAHHVRLRGRVDHWLLPALRSPVVERVVAIAETLAAELARHGVPPERILVAPDAADSPAATPPPRSESGRPLRCTYAGSLDPLKGLSTLLAAARTLPAVEFEVIGGTPAPARDRAGGPATANVQWRGAVPPAEVARLLATADVLLMPHAARAASRYLSPLKLFEYLAAGRAIVASDLPATREILTHEANALLVAPDDAPALAQAIARLAGDPVLRTRLGAAARDSAAGRTWRARATRILDRLPARRPDRLRVGHLLNSFHPLVGGAERQAAALGNRQAAQGHAVTAITRRRPGLPAVDGVGGVAIHRLFAGFGAASFIAAGLAFLASRATPFDVLHAHQARSNAVLGLLGRRAGGPLVVKVAGLDVPRGKRLGDRLRRQLLQRADAVVALTSVMRDELLQLGVPPLRLHIIPNGVDAERFRPATPAERAAARAACGVGREYPVVLFMGRLERVKGPDLALAAFEDLARAGEANHARLLIVGQGPLAAELGRRAQAIAGGQVALLGEVADPVPLYRAADILLAPSRSEGLSNTLLEAMACGLAIVATHAGGNPDLLADGATACLVPPAREPLAAALRSLLREPERRAALGAAAAREARRSYDLGRITERYEELYRSLLG
jgi:glycosyltransferase involved in cell wall biosynthesis